MLSLFKFKRNFFSQNQLLGSYLLFTNLSNTNPALKTILAVGGSNEGSEKYSIMASTAENRQAFVDSAVTFLKKYGFDGLGTFSKAQITLMN